MKPTQSPLLPGDTSLANPVPLEEVILSIRGLRVILDADLSRLYGVPTKAIVQAVGRNRDRFPKDFMLRLTRHEVRGLKNRLLIPASGSGGTRYRPLAFTEQGVAMLSSVLRSPRAVKVNIEIMRAFVRLRRLLMEHADLAERVAELEKRYEGQFQVVFDALRALMKGSESPEERIGFRTTDVPHHAGSVANPPPDPRASVRNVVPGTRLPVP